LPWWPCHVNLLSFLCPPPPPPKAALRLYRSSRNLPRSFRRRAVDSDRKTGRGNGYREVLLDGLEGVALERDEHVLKLLREHGEWRRIQVALGNQSTPTINIW